MTQQVAAVPYRYRQPSGDSRKSTPDPVGPGRRARGSPLFGPAATYTLLRNRLGKRCHEVVPTAIGMARCVVARESDMKSTRAFPTCHFTHRPFIVGTTSRMKATRPISAESVRPLVFLDFDDVLCVNRPYGGYDVIAPDPPADLWARLFHPPAVSTLLRIIEEHEPLVVITTSWLGFLDRTGIERVLQRTGLGAASDSLHRESEATQDRGMTRMQAIERWLAHNHCGEAWVALDDVQSGTGLPGSTHHRAGRIVLCDVGIGLHAGHLPAVRRALKGSAAS